MRSRCSALLAGVFAAFFALMPVLHAGNTGIGRHLDQDGLEYTVISSGAWRLASDQLDKMLDKMVWQNKLTGAERRELLRKITLYRLLRDVSGLENATGFGRSSSRLDKNYIHNRAFLQIDTGAPGVINEFPGRNTVHARRFFSQLPAGTEFAAAAEIYPEALLGAIQKSGSVGEMLSGYLPVSLPLPELFKQSGGVWQFIFVRHGKEFFWQLDVPDKEGRWFTMAMLIGKKGKNFSSSGVLLPFAIAEKFPVAVKRKAGIRIYSSAAAEKYFTTAPVMKISKEYETALFNRMPESGAAVFFCNCTDELGSVELGGLKLHTATGLPALAVLARGGDGWLYTENCDRTFLFGDVMNMIAAVPFIRSLNLDESNGKESDAAGGDEENAGEKSAGEKKIDAECPCPARLATVKILLEKRVNDKPGFYTVSKNNDGSLRLDAGKKGEHQLVRFSRIENCKNAPAAICVCHDDHFCVLFVNGEIKCFKLAELGNYRRMVGYLHTLYMYDEAVFGKLMEEAAGFDAK